MSSEKKHRDSFYIKIKEINEARIHAGLPPLKQKNRTCIKCEKEFISYSLAERVCPYCHHLKKEHLKKVSYA